MRAVARGTLDGSDPLVAVFDELALTTGTIADGGAWEREDGRLTSLQRWVATRDPAHAVRAVLGRGAIDATYAVRGDLHELTLLPTGEGRAGRGERQAFERRLRDWAAEYARYVDAVAELWSRLELRPERAEPLLRLLLDETEDDEPLLEPGELELLERIASRKARLLEAFEAGVGGAAGSAAVSRSDSGRPEDDDAFSLQELSRLVYDPLPGALLLELPTPALRSEGFEADGATLRAPRPGLWQAWSSLAERWLAPNPVVLEIQALREEIELDVEQVLALERRAPAAPLTAEEILDAFAESMRGPEIYSVQWRVELPE
ncbi:MAG: hypothetical protein DWQ36_14270 [Acidobacteria bacterium]|nr:MAG: hypothetical protein DWQ30_19680 [Acidobacteriota bacterium]REK06370.1 MAG: hypothetical protein DWQ36_14270 [Acidobacteriota bacterium]